MSDFPVATIIIPTHAHGVTLHASVGSALRQTVPVEVFVIGDGVNDETRSAAVELAAADPRVRFFDHPKGERHGEAYRHEALREARGRIVCYLDDDDIYLPHHVEVMDRLLEEADFAHALTVQVLPDQSIQVWTIDLGLAAHREELMLGRNRIPLSGGAHTLDMYWDLEEGWAPAPAGIPTDLHMWKKFIADPVCRFRAARKPTVLALLGSQRPNRSNAERLVELRHWENRTAGEEGVAALEREVMELKVQESCRLDAKVMEAERHGGELLRPDYCQLFWAADEGFSEANSVAIPLEFSAWRTIEYDAPVTGLNARMRFDPATQPCLIEIVHLKLRRRNGDMLWRMSGGNAHELRIAGDAVLVSSGQILEILSDGADPQIYLPEISLAGAEETVRFSATIRLDAGTRRMAEAFARYLRILG